MNIAYVTADADAPVFGSRGCSVHIQETLRAILRKGDMVDLFAGGYGGPINAEFSSLRMFSVAPARAATPADVERAAIAANSTLREVLSNRHFEQPFSFVYERYSLWSHTGMEFAREKDIPGILEVNAPLLDEVNRRHLLIHRAAAEDATMRAFRAATVIVVGSQQLAHIVQQHPSASDKVRIIPNGVDPQRFGDVVPTIPRKEGEFVIGFTGELRPWQGLSSLISAFALVVDALPHCRLLLVGDGPDREALEREVAAKGLRDVVRFVGAVPPHAVPGFLASMDVAVAPYPHLAGFYASPLKIFEYMAAGLPIVASRIGQVREVLTHGCTGILVTPGNREELAETLYTLEQDPAKRAEMGAAARVQAAMSHGWDETIGQILGLATETSLFEKNPNRSQHRFAGT